MSEPKCLAEPIDWAFALTVRRISSIHRLKRIGDKRHPCLTPDKIGIDEVLPAGVRTSVDAFVYMLPHEGHHRVWDTEMGKGCRDDIMWDAAKSITEVEPCKIDILVMSITVEDEGLEDKCMFITSFRGTSTFLR